MIRRAFSAALAAVVLASPLASQQRPTAAEAQALLGSRSDLVRQLQAQIRTSGLSPAQVRQRLKAEGYPENLLDAYLSGNAQPDSASSLSDDVFAAFRLLGVDDTLRLDSLRGVARRQRRSKAQLDSAFLDTLARAALDDSTRAAMRRMLRNVESRRNQVDSGFTVFGLNLFQNETTQFDPNQAGAVDENYRIGPGDRLVLVLTGDLEASHVLDVTRSGNVLIPGVGQMSVANLTLGQLTERLYPALGRVYSGVRRGPGATTHFSVDIGRLGTNQVTVTGDVREPGSFRVSRAATLLTALYAAKGPSDNGSLRTVQVRHSDGRFVGALDLYDYLLRGDASKDPRLENGDIIFVPPRGRRVRVAGAVLRPATYELKAGETLASLIEMAGGFAPTADRRRVQVDRILPPAMRGSAGSERQLIDVASALFATGFGPPEPLEPGDIVRVFTIPERQANRVTIEGNVWSPGLVGFAPGMRLSDALRRAGGLKTDTYLGEIQVSRLRPDSSREMLLAAARDTVGNMVDDIALHDDDHIRVFSITEFRPNRYVTITGAVRGAGRFRFHEGMTLRGLVLLAGGLQESALLTRAEIARLPDDRSNGRTAETRVISLDSSYLFEREAGRPYSGPPGIQSAAAGAPDIPLEPYDAVLIFQQPDWALERLVAITGEVKYPGKYALKSKSDRLSDIISRAGGITADGYPNGIVFIRNRGQLGRIGVDLPAVLRDNAHIDNLILVDQDSIYVPGYSAVVTVRGAVNSPVAVPYVRGADIDYYIRAAGGGNLRADEGKAYVSQPNGKVESRRRTVAMFISNPTPQPGSTVYVPEQNETAKTNWIAIASTATSVLGSLVAIAALLRR